MTEFDGSNWAKPEFSDAYRENADIFIVERRRMFHIVKSYYVQFFSRNKQRSILDLGCGDGILSNELLNVDGSLSATLVDGSADMLDKARERLKRFKDVHYVNASFQDIIGQRILERQFDFIFSSLAIHHLTMDEKTALFKTIYSHLSGGGHFLNIDVVLAPAEPLEKWYLSLWKEWIDERKETLGREGGPFDNIIQRYKDNKDNKPDTLDDQLKVLERIGFRDVDCYYKYGIFSMYGGRKYKRLRQ